MIADIKKEKDYEEKSRVSNALWLMKVLKRLCANPNPNPNPNPLYLSLGITSQTLGPDLHLRDITFLIPCFLWTEQ